MQLQLMSKVDASGVGWLMPVAIALLGLRQED